MFIISIEANEQGRHECESQSHRTECWLEGYISVPNDLIDAIGDCKGYCDLIIEEGVLINIEPHPELIPEPEQPSDSGELERIESLESVMNALLNGEG